MEGSKHERRVLASAWISKVCDLVGEWKGAGRHRGPWLRGAIAIGSAVVWWDRCEFWLGMVEEVTVGSGWYDRATVKVCTADRVCNEDGEVGPSEDDMRTDWMQGGGQRHDEG